MTRLHPWNSPQSVSANPSPTNTDFRITDCFLFHVDRLHKWRLLLTWGSSNSLTTWLRRRVWCLQDDETFAIICSSWTSCVNSVVQHVHSRRRYFPSRDDDRKLVYRQWQRLVHGLLDQEVLAEFIQHWQSERLDDKWFFKPAADVRVSSDDCVSDASENKSSFLLIYQVVWQQHLLSLYSKELVFMDATYKTSKYAVPMFFVSVQTNCGHFVVGVFLMETEDSQSLTEALQIFSSMNNNWSLKVAMLVSERWDVSVCITSAEITFCQN